MTFEEIDNFYMLSDSDEILLVWYDGVAGWQFAQFSFAQFLSENLMGRIEKAHANLRAIAK